MIVFTAHFAPCPDSFSLVQSMNVDSFRSIKKCKDHDGMARRAGSADLPLHGSRVPKWLGDLMTRLGAVMSQAIVHHYGRGEPLRRRAHPFWFQSFGAVMGMDWHSSGITTSVIGALKRGLTPLAGELGVHVCGGRGRYSRQTPDELVTIGERMGFDGGALAKASRLVAKVDSAAVQDGFDLYLHGFVVTDAGQWVVIQQGMNGECRQARRYHWLSEGLKSFVDEPHAAIEGAGQGEIVSLTDRRADLSRRVQLDVLHSWGPDRVAREVMALEARGNGPAVPDPEQPVLPHLVMPAHPSTRVSAPISRSRSSQCGLAAGWQTEPVTRCLVGSGCLRRKVSEHMPPRLLIQLCLDGVPLCQRTRGLGRRSGADLINKPVQVRQPAP